jgi:hypothetical protein
VNVGVTVAVGVRQVSGVPVGAGVNVVVGVPVGVGVNSVSVKFTFCVGPLVQSPAAAIVTGLVGPEVL